MLLSYHHATAWQWVFLSLLISMCSGMVAVVCVSVQFGRPSFSAQLIRSKICEGLVFSASSSAANVYNDIDKAMLVHFGMNAANGIYTMAYRAVDMMMVPISSIHIAAFPLFFQKGKAGPQAAEDFGRRILRYTAPISILVAVILWSAAPLIPGLLGDGFRESVQALRIVCFLPVFRSLHLAAGDALTGSGQQSTRLCTQLVVAAANFAANIYMIPAFGWRGAAWSSLLSDGLLGGLNWTVLIASRERATWMTSESLKRQIAAGVSFWTRHRKV